MYYGTSAIAGLEWTIVMMHCLLRERRKYMHTRGVPSETKTHCCEGTRHVCCKVISDIERVRDFRVSNAPQCASYLAWGGANFDDGLSSSF
eukprot:6191852-Pleurochrysis_carterae.AAC.2